MSTRVRDLPTLSALPVVQGTLTITTTGPGVQHRAQVRVTPEEADAIYGLVLRYLARRKGRM